MKFQPTIEEYDVAQGDPQWHQLRAGTISGSNFHLARKRLVSGKNKGEHTADTKKYAFRLAVERISGEPLQDEQFETYAMRRGNELEPDARAAHEKRIGKFVQRVGFVRTTDGLFGASADGYIDVDGGSEYKCFVDATKMRSIIIDADVSEVRDQVQGGLWLTNRKWWHIGLYCPGLATIGKELFIIEDERDDEYIEEMVADLVLFNRLVEDYKAEIERAETFRSIKSPAVQAVANSIF